MIGKVGACVIRERIPSATDRRYLLSLSRQRKGKCHIAFFTVAQQQFFVLIRLPLELCNASSLHMVIHLFKNFQCILVGQDLIE